MSKTKNQNYKNWLLLVYPDEAYEDWLRRLINIGSKIAVSPLHENDTWRSGDEMVNNPRCGCSPELKDYNRSKRFIQLFKDWLSRHNDELQSSDGVVPDDQIYAENKPKKPHYHVILCFAGSKSDDQVKQICRECIAPDPPLPFRCHDLGGSTRYLIHYDQPDKEQFTITSIQTYNGFDIAKYFKPTLAQEDELFYSIAHLCHTEDLYSFSDLMDWLVVRSQNDDYLEEFRYARSHCNLVKSYVESRGRSRRYKEIDKADTDRLRAISRIADVIDKKFM